MPRGRAAIGQVRSGQLGVAIGAPTGNRIWVIEAWMGCWDSSYHGYQDGGGQLSSRRPRSSHRQEGRQRILPDRAPGLEEDKPYWVLRSQHCHGPGRGPAVTQRPAEATHLDTPQPALPVALEAGAQGLSTLLPTGTDDISRTSS